MQALPVSSKYAKCKLSDFRSAAAAFFSDFSLSLSSPLYHRVFFSVSLHVNERHIFYGIFKATFLFYYTFDCVSNEKPYTIRCLSTTLPSPPLSLSLCHLCQLPVVKSTALHQNINAYSSHFFLFSFAFLH